MDNEEELYKLVSKGFVTLNEFAAKLKPAMTHGGANRLFDAGKNQIVSGQGKLATLARSPSLNDKDYEEIMGQAQESMAKAMANFESAINNQTTIRGKRKEGLLEDLDCIRNAVPPSPSQVNALFASEFALDDDAPPPDKPKIKSPLKRTGNLISFPSPGSHGRTR